MLYSKGKLFAITGKAQSVSHLKHSSHRDKTRVQMPAKMFPHLKLLCWLFMGPTLGFDTKQRNSFLIKLGIFYNYRKILTILFIVKYEKITLFDVFLVLLGPIISRFLHVKVRKK